MTVSRGLVEVPDAALSVAGVTRYIQELLEEDPQLYRIWVVGEVSSASDRSGHLFFTLQDVEGGASIQAVVWRSQRSQLVSQPTSGEQFFVLGQVRVYAQRGQYQLMALQVLPAGAGLKALRRRQLQHRLMAEGLFDPDLKQALPSYPQTVAVVTSAQAAAWGDIRRTLQQRQPGLRVLLSPAIVQGTQAPDSIAAALERVVNDGQSEVVLLSRGGGAREDLDAFDDERVVRAIAMCPIPIVTGIGHERDETLADLAADVVAHTPTAAAECAVPDIVDVWHAHRDRHQMLKSAFQSAVQMQYEQVADLRRRLETLNLDKRLHQEQQQLTWRRQQLRQIVRYRLQGARQQCDYLSQALHSLDPESVLKRGYAIVRMERDLIVTTADQASAGDILTIQLAQGAIAARVLATSDSGASDADSHPSMTGGSLNLDESKTNQSSHN